MPARHNSSDMPRILSVMLPMQSLVAIFCCVFFRVDFRLGEYSFNPDNVLSESNGKLVGVIH
jgi:hypothetical protein